MTGDRRPFTITKVEVHPEGYWTANVTHTESGFTYPVDRKHGSWRLLVDDEMGWHDCLPHVAAALQDRIRPLERKQKAEATA